MDGVETGRVLWVSAEDQAQELAGIAATLGEFQLDHAAGVPEALEHLTRSRIDAAVVECPVPQWSSLEVLDALMQASDLPVVILDRGAGVQAAVKLLQCGAFHCFGDIVAADELCEVIQAAIEDHRSRFPKVGQATWKEMLVGSCRAFEEVTRMVQLVASRHSTVLVTGATGTGKEMVARAIHLASPRGRLPMVAISCSAIPENLLEAELFGHVRGAFTGAVNQRAGRFEQADGSTLFLDEIGDMPLNLQAKLLRVLQEREFQRLGSSETVRVDVRVIAATNADLAGLVRAGRFREDLYYRLNVVPIRLPSLHERNGDVPALTYHFIEKICRIEKIPTKRISREALQQLSRYPWPGNVRQLENAVERAVVLTGERMMLYPADFALEPRLRKPTPIASVTPFVQVPDEGLDFEETVDGIARGIIEQALRKTKGNKKMAADMLGLKRTTLAAKLRSLDSDWEAGGQGADYVHIA